MHGWVRFYREQFSDLISRKPFCWGYVWTFLYAMAAHKEGHIFFDNGTIVIKRGQLITSQRKLAENFGWSIEKIRQFLNALKIVKLIEFSSTKRYTLITIINYDGYQKETSNLQADSQQNPIQSTNKINTKSEPYNNDNNEKNEQNKKLYMPDSEEIQLSEFLLSEIRKRKPDYKQPNLQSWAKHIGHILHIDNRNPDKLKDVIVWCQQDQFWQNNILSPQKLRLHFDRLELQMERRKPEQADEEEFYERIR